MKQLAPILVLLMPLAIGVGASAQTMDHMSMPGMSMPMPAAKPHPKPAAVAHARKPTKPKAARHRRRRAAQAAPSMAGMSMPVAGAQGMAAMPSMAMPRITPQTAPSADHDMAAMQMPNAPLASGGGMAGMTGMATSQPPSASGAMADMPGMKGMDMSGAARGTPTSADAPAPEANELEIPNTPPPPAPMDHAADRFFDPAAMAAARAQLRREHGAEPWSMVMANLAEYQARSGGGGYRWEGEASFGGDINRLFLRSEGEGSRRTGLDSAELQVLYSRTITPYFNLQAGVRQDFKPKPESTYATIGFEGLAPYWFEVSGAAFLSTKGDVLGRLEGYEDFRITQRLILQPRAELNLSAQNVPQLGIGSGVTNLELGLRLRYEITRQFAPYMGVSFDQKFGATADFARARGEQAGVPSLVFGIRTWF
jgi:copper resistance protein B